MATGGAKQQRAPISLAHATDREFARHILTFDSDRPATYSTHTLPQAAIMRSAARSPIPWPAGQAPTPSLIRPAPSPSAALSQHDYLIVTWTEEEGKCLADTLTPGFPSQTAWYDYTHNFQSEYVPLIRNGAPALESKRLGSYFPTTMGGKRALCFKSELHFSQDGPKMPIAKLWAQLIQEVKPKLVITTGTAGGIGSAVELGDVVAAQAVRFDCTKAFRSLPFHNSVYQTSKLKTGSFAEAQKLFQANASHLPASKRPLQIFSKPAAGVKIDDVVTTDFFAYDDTANTFGLQSLGAAVEMGDAVLGLVIKQLGPSAPAWTAVRNASDPQMDTTGLTPTEVRAKAGQIYEKFGYWTTISSAIACWALVLDN
jgi:purine-nucleoside phosphorylase